MALPLIPDYVLLASKSVHRISCAFIWLLCLVFILRVRTFNVDLRTAVFHRGPVGSLFGFSVAMHRDRDYSWLLVGAPQAQTQQPGVEKGGSVYRCSIDAPDTCQQIPFDRSGSGNIVIRGSREQTDEKSHQWFGATVRSSGNNGAIVACAPRYVYFSTNLKRRDPVGSCWVARGSFTNFQEYAPCRTSAWGYHRQGSCQAGFSAAVTKDGRKLFIGAVGSWYWQGQVFSQDLLDKQSLVSTLESPEYNDDSYLGYSTAIGEFSGDRDPDIAVGMPRGSNLTGKVVLYNSTLFNIQNITGEQLGSYFGYALCTTDVNGDRLDDIIIGAPFYTDLSAKDGSYERGRIYVVYQNKKHRFESMSLIDGVHSRGRFGLALASVGDINSDGLKDFAVGAPYGGINGKGSVFIYHGNKNGLFKAPAQIIEADDFHQPSLKTFGFSLDGGMDLDNNEYPDLLVGAYDSNAAIFLRSSPVVNAKASLKIDPEKINLDDKGCSLQDGTLVSCVVLSFCLEYTGTGVEPNIGFLYQTVLDAENQVPRVYFLNNENQNEQNVTVNLTKDIKYCKSVYTYIQNNVRDKLTPIAVEIVYSLFDPDPSQIFLKPVLNKKVSNVLSKQVTIQKNCGKDNICIPDLKLTVLPNMKQFLIGSTKKLKFDITVVNIKEDAFEAMLYVTLPLDVNYVNVDKSKLDFPVSCSGAHPEVTGVNELICDIGNPLPANKSLNFKIILAPSRQVTTISNLTFEFSVNSTNEEFEETKPDNHKVINLLSRVEVNVTLHGLSEPQIVSYNKSEIYPEHKASESDAGPEVVHIYAVGNRGPTTVREAEIRILWPTYTLFGKHLLYLMDQPELKGKGFCQQVSNVNPLLLKKEKKPRSSSSTSISDLRSIGREVIENANMEEHTSRKRRQIEKSEQNSTSEFEQELECGPTQCTQIVCTLYGLAKDDQVVIVIRSRLWKQTLDELGLDDVQISSKLLARVTSLPYDVDPSYLSYKVYSVTTKVNTEDSRAKPQLIPWWILIVSVSAGFLLLGLLALLLWKFGFFRRWRPQDEMEKPLHNNHKNGYYLTKGDEYL